MRPADTGSWSEGKEVAPEGGTEMGLDKSTSSEDPCECCSGVTTTGEARLEPELEDGIDWRVCLLEGCSPPEACGLMGLFEEYNGASGSGKEELLMAASFAAACAFISERDRSHVSGMVK
jgi:hypothetical protein